MSPDDFAKSQADLWKTGLAKWDEGPERIKRFCDTVDRVIYTPGSSAGIPITVLKSFSAPPKEFVADADAFNERVASATSGLLALMGIDADPVKSREHIFLSMLLDTAWRAGKDVDLRQLIQDINRPPISKIGAVDVDSFYPAKDRTKLAMNLNNLLASPSFASWLEGEPLDIQNILYTSDKKPRLAIFSIAHLDDAQRMFFVTILLNEILSWIRTQPGTSSLRALLYMDEVFGYFPPLGNPPAKRPMLTLLKQARAFGLGCVLATQNPVDLDYKGLSNAGTWFLGRLQTERDKARVMEGLEGASAQAGSSFNRNQMEAALAALGNRVFLMNNVHDNAPVVFESRWALSYLCGPLTKGQIKTLMDPVRAKHPFAKSDGAADVGMDGGAAPGGVAKPQAARGGGVAGASGDRPVVSAGIKEKFATISDRVPDGYRLEYRPGLLGKGKMHFVRKPDGIDVWQTCYLLQVIKDAPPDDIWQGAAINEAAPGTEDTPDSQAGFADLPVELSRDKSYPIFLKQLKDHLYREGSLKLSQCEALDAISKPGESEADFRARLTPLLAQQLATKRDALENSWSKKLMDANDRLAKAQAKVSARRMQFFAKLGSMLWVVFDTVMAAMGKNMPGRRRSLDPALRTMAAETGQSSNAKLDLERAQQDQQQLQQQHDDELKQLETSLSASGLTLDAIELKPQKGDISADEVSLVWLPFRVSSSGAAEAVYDKADA
ncbi:MAG TPA: ATP-binding protein, partial [Lacipirellulaceae bacterium]|nr:ATP-binding protein [Lacipirellulaceae bacterium]